MIRIDNIDQLIQAYQDELIDDTILIEILQEQTPQLAVWIDSDKGYNHSKAETLKGLQEYKSYLEMCGSYPIFFPETAATSSGFSFNNTLNNGKDL